MAGEWEGDRLRRSRREAGLTQAELALRSGVAVRTIRELERGRIAQPHPATSRALGKALPGPSGTRPPAEPRQDRIRIAVLGPLEVRTPTQRLWPGAPRRQLLLGYLALHHGRAVAADELRELAGTAGVALSGPALHTHISRLRRFLEQNRGPRDTPRLEFAHGYRLVVDPAELDLLALREATGKVRGAPPERAFELLAAAVDLVRGSVLAGLPQLASHPAVAAVDAEVHRAVLGFADAALATGHPDAAVPVLGRALAADPLDELLCARQMEALARTGRKAAALDLYRQTRERLVDDLGVDPGAELAGTFERVLRDRGRPAPEVPARPAQLPAAIADFTGRSGQVRQLRELLAREDGLAVRVVTISGPGGVGKTALAVHVAQAERGRYPDGQLHIDLRGAGAHPVPAADALATLLGALGVAAIPTDPDARSALLRTTLDGRRMLVLLDNARDQAQIRPLIPGSPGNAVLVTSRQALTDVPGAHHLDLATLDRDESLALLGTVCGPDRIAREPAAATAVAAACGDLPLALRVAGSRLAARPAWSVGTLADRLADGQRRLDELRHGDLAVRACFRLSYDMLDTALAAGFRLLGRWPGTQIAATTATALFGADAEPVLERLVDVHLLTTTAPGRYRMHDLLRTFAAEECRRQDPPAERDAALDRAIRFAAATAQHAHASMFPHRPPAPPEDLVDSPYALSFGGYEDAFRWWETECDDLTPAIEYAADAAALDPGPPARLALTLTRYHQIRNDMDGYLRKAQLGLRLAERAGNRRLVARLCLNLGVGLTNLDRPAEALPHHERALAEFRALGDEVNEARVIGNIACQDMEGGEYERAYQRFAESLALSRRLGDRDGETFVLIGLGETRARAGRYRDAEPHLDAALRLCATTGDRVYEASARELLSVVQAGQGRAADAITSGHRALELSRSSGSDEAEVAALTALAAAYRLAGAPDAALDHVLLAVAGCGPGGRTSLEAGALVEFGHVLHALGRHAEARTRWRAAHRRYHPAHPNAARIRDLLSVPQRA